MSNTVTLVKYYESAMQKNQDEADQILLKGKNIKQFTVEWDTDAKVTPSGSLVFFAQYLQSAGLMDRLCEKTPLNYTSNNAPDDRDIMGTVILSILNGQKRYATR